jgi:ParB family chromosome partitioning protein
MAKASFDLKKFAGVVQSATQRTPDRNIRIDLIDTESQVRSYFDPEKQAELDASVKAQGIIQPVVLLAKPDGRYRLVAGERRLRAARNNALEEIPAVVKTNLDAWEIRRIQVAENADRDDITPHDEARSISEDVEAYGVPKTMEIWNRSEGWVSKRTSVAKYADAVKQLLTDRVLADLEVAHSLNQLHALDLQEYARLDKRLRDGLPLSRDEVRGKVQQVREWQSEAKQRTQRLEKLGTSARAGASSANVTPTAATKGTKRSGAGTAAAAPPAAASNTPSAVAATARSSAADTAPVAAAPASTATNAGAGDGESRQGEAPITSEQALVLDQMVTLYQNGLANLELMKDVQAELADMGADMNQTEWAMWSLYQTVALPLIGALGDARARRYLERLAAELRGASPQELWNKLHPAADQAKADDWTAPREPVAPMPKDWRF